MTRYTNLGYKRSYVEATQPEGAPPAREDGAAPLIAGQDDPDAPKKKKTHRAGKKWSKKRKHEDVTGDGEGAGEGEAGNTLNGGTGGNGRTTGMDAADGQRPMKKRKTGAGSVPEGDSNSSSAAHPETGAGSEPASAPAAEAASSQKSKAKPKKKFERNKRERDAQARALASEERRLSRISSRQSQTVCFACRQTGHSIRDCPSAPSTSTSNPDKIALKSETLCYRCGSHTHTLSRCRKPALGGGELPFAKCFVCGGAGHLAGQCGENERGVYPRGGSCKVCGEVTHLAKDCPLRAKDTQGDAFVLGMSTGGGDEDDFHVLKRRKAEVDREESASSKKPSEVALAKPKKVVKF